MSRYALVLFDLDGTLFDHERAAREGVTAWLASHGIEADERLLSRWFEAESRYVAAWHRGDMGWQEQRRVRLREMLELIGDPAGDEDALDQGFDVYLAAYVRAWHAYPDVDDALRAVEAHGARVAVLTNGADRQQRQKVLALGLQGRLGPVFSSDAIGFAKPDPRAFAHVCSQLEFPPSAVLHVGGRYDLDVTAARHAGLDAVHLDRDNQGPLEETMRMTSLSGLGTFLSSGTV